MSTRYYKRVRYLAVIVGIVLALGASTLTVAAPAKISPAALPFALSWSREFLTAAPVAAAVSDGGWLVAGFQDRLELVALESGASLGSLPLPARHLGCNVTICVAGDDTTVRAIDLQQRTARWQKTTPGPLAFPPLLRSGWVFLVSTTGRIAALREDDGAEVWSMSASAPLAGPLSVDGDRMAMTTTDDVVTLLDLRTGRAVWTREIFDGKVGAPRLGGGMVYVGTETRQLLFIDASNGRITDRQRTGATIVGAPALDEHLIYTCGQDGVLRAFDRNTGAVQWYSDLPTRPANAGPVATANMAIVALRTGAFLGFLADGDGKRPAVSIAAPLPAGATPAATTPAAAPGAQAQPDGMLRLPVPPMVTGLGTSTRLITISFNVGDSSKWMATVVAGAAKLPISAEPMTLPKTLPGLPLKLTAPR